MPTSSECRVLSIQSHVVSGYVGNKSATFPLQLLGYEVDSINSVQFSNHTGYAKGIRGQILDDAELWDLFEGLLENGIADGYSHVINGYIGSASFLKKLAEVVKKAKELNPNLTYVCDPVMGDFGPGMYVDESLLPIYRDVIVPLADVCVPNQFEAELITGMKIKDEGDAFEAMDYFHGLGVETVILSSTELDVNRLVALASTRSRPNEAVRIYIPKLPAAFVGTGDLFTALSTAWLAKTNNDLAATLEKTIGTMQAVLNRTLDYAKARTKEGEKPSARDMELKLIQSKRDIEEPRVTAKAEVIAKKA